MTFEEQLQLNNIEYMFTMKKQPPITKEIKFMLIKKLQQIKGTDSLERVRIDLCKFKLNSLKTI